MPKGFWDASKPLGPSAGLVQQHYINSRLADLKRINPKFDEEVKDAVLKYCPNIDSKGDKWLEAYDKLNTWLQQSDLTINFKAENWFSTENHYESYAQTYELNNRGELLSAGLDPARTRANVDDKVTLPTAWGVPSRPSAPAPGAPRTRQGLRPGIQSGQRIAAQMAFNAKTSLINPNVDIFDAGFGKEIGVKSGNSRFNPKTKQIFAALNYAHRPHGSSTSYGRSHFVISPRFKANALYFPQDTFSIQANGTSSQTPYSALGSIITKAFVGVFDLVNACFHGQQCGDTHEGFKLMEAHLFTSLPFTGNIEAIHLSAPARSVIHRNAERFAEKHGARLVLVD